MAYVIISGCIDCKDAACTTVCPVDCIYEGGRMFYIHPDECISCGLCESVCPPDAIYSEEHLPDREQSYLKINAEFFGEQVTGWGDPGGASDKWQTDQDHPLVAAHPLNSSKS